MIRKTLVFALVLCLVFSIDAKPDEQDQFVTEYESHECMKDCMDKKIDKSKTAVHKPSNKEEFDRNIREYRACFDEKCPKGMREKFDDPEIIQDKSEGQEIAECVDSCYDKLDGKFYQIQEICKFDCFIDKSHTGGEYMSGFIFLGIVGALVGYLFYKKSQN